MIYSYSLAITYWVLYTSRMRAVGTIIGIDLAGYSKKSAKKVGIAILSQDGGLKWTNLAAESIPNTNEDLFTLCLKHSSQLIAIDAPLDLPLDFLKMIETQSPILEGDGGYKKMFRRQIELPKNIRLGCLEGLMSKITIRGLHFKYLARLRNPSCQILEVYPRATAKQMGLEDYKDSSPEIIRTMIWNIQSVYGYTIFIDNEGLKQASLNEIDAIICCLTGLLYILENPSVPRTSRHDISGWYTPTTNWASSTNWRE